MAQDTRTIRIEIANIQMNESGMNVSAKKNSYKSSVGTKLTGEQIIERDRRAYQSNVSDNINAIMHPINDLTKDYAANSVRKQAIVGLAQQTMETIERSLDYVVNRHLNLTEDYLSQNNYNKIKSIYNTAKGVATSVAAGAASGAAFGPAGVVAGAALGLVNWGVNTAIQESQRYSQYYQQLNATNFNTQYNAKRAGLYDGSRGTES